MHIPVEVGHYEPNEDVIAWDDQEAMVLSLLPDPGHDLILTSRSRVTRLRRCAEELHHQPPRRNGVSVSAQVTGQKIRDEH
jgi:hypothetical protein